MQPVTRLRLERDGRRFPLRLRRAELEARAPLEIGADEVGRIAPEELFDRILGRVAIRVVAEGVEQERPRGAVARISGGRIIDEERQRLRRIVGAEAEPVLACGAAILRLERQRRIQEYEWRERSPGPWPAEVQVDGGGRRVVRLVHVNLLQIRMQHNEIEEAGRQKAPGGRA